MGDMPKIGIRPTIDGRLGGVRESMEEQTMNMARAVADMLESNLRHANGLPVECVLADGTIGRVAESAACAEKFRKEGVGLTLTVTPCWCYGSETMDMDAHMPKAIFGFNGTERPGAVYLAAVLAGHTQKGLPAFSVYGRDVQDSDDTSIRPDVAEKLLQFARAGLAVATMRGKSYLSIGGTSMGIAGSIVDQPLFESYLGMRVEDIDMTEIVRRVHEEIYDGEEFGRALAWSDENLTKGGDYNPPEMQRSQEKQDAAWDFSVKMAMIVRDLMVGNPRLAEIGFGEEALGHNAIAAGFQGQRQWTDHFPNGDFMEALLNSSWDWNGIRQPYMVATENDAL
ncbi:MAG: L-fucose isomerase, partial [Chloroflexi bacterium]|nr:L-fucose isomerase [Chloroflexota bacterium]